MVRAEEMGVQTYCEKREEEQGPTDSNTSVCQRAEFVCIIAARNEFWAG